jgi:hypothetical protein
MPFQLCNQWQSQKQAVSLSKYPMSEGLYCWDFCLPYFSSVNSSSIAKVRFWKWNLILFALSLFHRLDSNGNQTGNLLLTWPLSYLCARLITVSLWDDSVNTKVSLCHWPPVWLVRNQLYDNRQFLFFLQSRLIQTSQTGGQEYSDTSPFSIPWLIHKQD